MKWNCNLGIWWCDWYLRIDKPVTTTSQIKMAKTGWGSFQILFIPMPALYHFMKI